MVNMCKMIISPGFLKSFSKLWYFGLLGGAKGQKIVQNDKKICLSCSIFQEPYIIWLSYMVHMCKVIISPGVFSLFENFDFLGC